MTSEQPSPLTSPAVATEQLKRALLWLPSAVHDEKVTSPAADPW